MTFIKRNWQAVTATACAATWLVVVALGTLTIGFDATTRLIFGR